MVHGQANSNVMCVHCMIPIFSISFILCAVYMKIGTKSASNSLLVKPKVMCVGTLESARPNLSSCYYVIIKHIPLVSHIIHLQSEVQW